MSMFDKLKDKCTKKYVTRAELRNLTGGILSVPALIKLDSLGEGIKNRELVRGKTMYKIDDVIEWLESNTKRIK